MAPAVTELLYPHPAHSWTRRLAMYPRLRPPQRGQTNPFGHRCAVRCSPHRTSSPKRERNSLTVMMGFLFNRLGFFMSDIISPFIRLVKLDIHLNLLTIAIPGRSCWTNEFKTVMLPWNSVSESFLGGQQITDEESTTYRRASLSATD